MTQTTEASERRVPKQARSEQRVAAILAAAEEVIAQNGFDGTTLTEVARRAGTSIGSLYQYFPDKPAVAAALASRYGAELADLWAARMVDATDLSPRGLAARIIDIVLGFKQDRPAYLQLVSSVPGYRHSDQNRQRLRSCIAAVLAPRLGPGGDQRAPIVTELVIETVKSLTNALGPASDKAAVTGEYAIMLQSYFEAVLTA